MSETECDLPLDDLIDRIVDGALTPAELKCASVRLEQAPDGWKRCALAFLEAQAWRDAMCSIGQPAHARGERKFCSLLPVEFETLANKRSPRHWWRRLAVAATAVFAFSLGWVSHSARTPRAATEHPAALTVPVATGRDEKSTADTKTPAEVEPAPAPSARLVALPGDDRSRPIPRPLVQTVGRLRIGPEGAAAVLPIVAGPGIDERWLRQQPPPVSEYGQAVLQRLGYQVDQRRRLLVAKLADGRRVTVPIDEVQILYTGSNPL
jgi:hypothetical protein